MIRKTSLAAAIALGMGLISLGQPVAQAANGAAANAVAEQSRYLVFFEEPSLATFRGFEADSKLARSSWAKSLKATSPAITGARHLDVSTPDSIAYRQYLAAQRQTRLDDAASRIGRTLTPDFVYDVATNGMAVSISAAEATLLRDVPGVKRVVLDFKRKPMTDSGPRWIHADQIWNGPGDIANEGEGVVVGVVDSGIDATHAAFAGTGPVDGYVHSNPRGSRLGLCAGGGGGCNDKLIGIYDFTTSGAETNDGSDQTGHGTHVASTAAGNRQNVSIVVGSTTEISGVAPHANLIMYKACENVATCEGAWLVAAIDQAVADQVDVINYSIGGGTNNPWQDGDSLQFLAAREAGILPVISAGNDGPGESTVSSPANAPWVMSAAAVTHDRLIQNRLTDFTGGEGAAPGGGVLFGAGATLGYGPAEIVYAGDYGSALCAQGANTGASPPDTSTNPWPTAAGQQPFNGEIVVCDRGDYARVIKSYNVGLAGGGGFVLANSSAEGESVVRDAHSIPGIHIGYQSGVALKDWLSHGSGHMATITGEQLIHDPSVGDLLASFSGRGPVLWGSYLSPNISAPGVNILAAVPPALADDPGFPFDYYSGTSMAAPHVTGSVALLIAAHPDWNPSQLASALQTTARSTVKINADTPATPMDQGSGVVELDKAVRAGLYFPISKSNFDAAEGGDTRAMNLPALVDESCFITCGMTRTVKDMAGGGSWTAEFDLPSGAVASVSPNSFTLGSGESRALNFTFNVGGAEVSGDWVFGSLRLVRGGSDEVSDVELPIAIKSDAGDLPEIIEIDADSESGFVDVNLDGLVALPQARFASSKLVESTTVLRKLKRGSTRTDAYAAPFDDSLFELFASGASDSSRTLSVSASAPNTSLINLYVGVDANGNGQPEEGEELCLREDGTSNTKTCIVDVPPLSASVNLWVMAQSRQPGNAVIEDQVTMTYELTDPTIDSGTAMAITGPGQVAQGDAFPVRISWDIPSLLPGGSRKGYLMLGAQAGREGKTAQIPVKITRTGEENAAAALVSGRARSMSLAAGAAQDRLFIDVPPNASRLHITSSGTGEVDLYAAWAGDFPGAQSDASIAAAPARGQAEGTSIHAGASEDIDLQGAVLKPGRWYVTPVNSGDDAASFALTATVTSGAGVPPTPRFGGYYNPQRSGSGGYLFEAGGALAYVWYTYLEDGTPTWYLGAGAKPAGTAGSWTVDLYRYSWNGSAYGRKVGEATLTQLEPQAFAFTWNLDGKTGSERYQWIDAGACPLEDGVPVELGAGWYSPSESGYGFSVSVFDAIEASAAYFYDDNGIARWSLGSVVPYGSDTLPMSIFTGGACPSCTFHAPTGVVAGSYVRSYDGNSNTGHAALDIQLPSPMSGHWQTEADMVPSTNYAACPL